MTSKILTYPKTSFASLSLSNTLFCKGYYIRKFILFTKIPIVPTRYTHTYI